MNFVEEPKCCYLMISKGKIQYYYKGKESEAGTRFIEVEKIINSFRRKIK